MTRKEVLVYIKDNYPNIEIFTTTSCKRGQVKVFGWFYDRNLLEITLTKLICEKEINLHDLTEEKLKQILDKALN